MRQNQKRRKGKYQMKEGLQRDRAYEFIKKERKKLSTTHLAILMNRSISEGATCIPAWKHVITTQFTSQVQNPSCLTTGLFQILPVFSKVQEKAVHRMVYDYLQIHNILQYLSTNQGSIHSIQLLPV